MLNSLIFQQGLVAGVDEVGCGSLAGPVVAAAVIFHTKQAPIKGLNDSKKLSKLQREKLAIVIQNTALSWAVAMASVEEIDQLNILQASLLAMQRAVNSLPIQPVAVLVDGLHLPDLSLPMQAIVKGDSKIAEISAASILAKVVRDNIMIDYHQSYPLFSFHSHKGYGTKRHHAEIEQFGFLNIHRKSFNPIKNLLIKQQVVDIYTASVFSNPI